jgi:hypothetical protein
MDTRVLSKSCGIYATQLMLLLWNAGTSIDARWRFGLNIDAPKWALAFCDLASAKRDNGRGFFYARMD